MGGKPHNQYFKGRVLKTKEDGDGVKSLVIFEDGDKQWLVLANEKVSYFKAKTPESE